MNAAMLDARSLCGCEQKSATREQIDAARKLLATEIHFVPSTSFREPRNLVLEDGSCPVGGTEASCKSLIPAEGGERTLLGNAELLDARTERELFRTMNYLKFRANALRVKLDPDRLDVEILREAQQLLARAATVRDRLIRSNIRLVMSIVKKFVSPRRTFDDLFSDGVTTLINAVDKFDFNLGFRFSTYAYRSIARTAYRAVSDEQRTSGRFVSNADDPGSVEDALVRRGSLRDEPTWEKLDGGLARLLDQLNPREQFIVRARFGLGEADEPRTCQAIADELGLSKERVRQLEYRALDKLRKLATDLELEELLRVQPER